MLLNDMPKILSNILCGTFKRFSNRASKFVYYIDTRLHLTWVIAGCKTFIVILMGGRLVRILGLCGTTDAYHDNEENKLMYRMKNPSFIGWGFCKSDLMRR